MIIRSLTVLVLALAANVHAANLLVNPGFEDQSLNDPGSFSIIEDWGKIGSGSAVIRNSNVVTSPLINNVLSLQPGAGVVQTFSTSLLPETTYRITLDYQGAAGRAFSFGVGLGTGSGGSSAIIAYELPEDVFAGGGDGPADSFLFIPASGAGSISFEFTTGNFSDWEWGSAAFWLQSYPPNPVGVILFDNITVGAVPEPSAGLLVATGAALLLFRRRRIGRILFLLPVLSLLPACSKPQPPLEKIEAALKATIPPYLEISDIQISTEEIFENEFRSKASAKVAPKEDLFTVDTAIEAAITSKVIGQFFNPDEEINFSQKWLRHKSGERVEATPAENAVLQNLGGLTFIKRVASQGEPVTVYGTITSGRIDSKFVVGDGIWEEAEILTKGQPRSAFPAEVTIVAPETVDTKVAEISAKVKAVIEAGKAKEEARKDKITAAFAKGKHYAGIWSDPGNGNTGKVNLRITESDGRTFEGVFFDPVKPEETKPAKGVINTGEKGYQATLIGVAGEGQPPRDDQIEGLHAFNAGKITRAQTYYRFLEIGSTVDFQLKIQEDGSLQGEGMLSASSGRGGRARASLELRPQAE